jgi:hypothetical protein
LGARGPALVRGDSGYGNQGIIEICEKHNRRYLLRLRKTANVKRLIERLQPTKAGKPLKTWCVWPVGAKSAAWWYCADVSNAMWR